MRILLSVLAVMVVMPQSPSNPQPLKLVSSIELPGVEGRIDHLAFDAVGQRLFVAALGNNTVEVLDVKAGRHVKSLLRFREPQGIAFVSEGKLVAVSNGQGEGLQLLHADDYQLGPTVRLGDDADNVRYDPTAKRLFVGFGSGAIAAIDSSSAKVVGEAKLAGHPESFQLERSGPRIFVNVPATDQVAVIDRTTMKVTATWPVVSAKANFPMALDEASHRLLIGCRRPARVLAYDTTSGKQIGSSDIVGDTDDMFYDAVRNRVYVIGGEGFVDVLGASLSRMARIPTAAGARTGLYVSEQSRIYVAVPHRGSQRAEIRIYDVAE